MSIRHFYAIGLLLSVLYTVNIESSFAYDGDRAISNLASDFCECGAYYTIAAEGLRRAGKLDGAASSEAASKVALEAAKKISRGDVVLARYKLALDEQIRAINEDYANVAILIKRYGSLCKQVTEDPLGRLRYWLDKK